MSEQPRSAITIEFGKPIAYDRADADKLPAATAQELQPVLASLAAYDDALTALIEGEYADRAHLLDAFYTSPRNLYLVRGTDGLIVRYETATERPRWHRTLVIQRPLKELAPMFSENVVHLPDDPRTYDPGPGGPRLRGMHVNAATGEEKEAWSARPIIYPARGASDEAGCWPGRRPHALVSATNSFDMRLVGEMTPADVSKHEVVASQPFIATSCVVLPVGWVAFQVYRDTDLDLWDPAQAPWWAERDLLETLAKTNATKLDLARYDGRSEARREVVALLREFASLLDGPEEPAHQFLKAHPEFICPTAERVWSKLPFGERVSDFVVRQAPDDYELVEIEAPHRELFRRDGQQREELTHAINQIWDWLGYIQRNHRDVEERLGLRGISTTPRCLVVIGRAAALSVANREKLATISSAIPKLRIMTYDDVIVSAATAFERVLGPLGSRGNFEYFFATRSRRP